jgi:hypothetical protein
VVIAFLLLAASVWNTQKPLDRSSLKVIVYDQLIDVPSEMDFNDDVLTISEGRLKMDYLAGEEVDVDMLKLGTGHPI